MGTTRPTQTTRQSERTKPSPRKSGRTLKSNDGLTKTSAASAISTSAPSPDDRPVVPPASIPFRAFKAALVNLKARGAPPERVDRSVWTNQLFGQDLHGMIHACRFLGLIDDQSRTTESCRALLVSVDTDAWPAELRRILEASYRPLLESSMSSLTAGGLLQMFRRTYRTPNELTRKCCSFFVHAGREAALDMGPFLLTNSRSRWIDGRRIDRRDTGDEANTMPCGDDVTRKRALTDLVAKLPNYDPSWSDDVKRLWLKAFNDLLERFDD